MTLLEQHLAQSTEGFEGLARQLSPRPTGNRKRDARECASAKRRLKSALRTGGVSWNYAARLARLMGVEETPLHDLLLKPRASWPTWALRAPETRTVASEQDIERHAQGAGHTAIRDRSPRKANPRRMEVLKVV
ncbi:hypothetical protein IAD21_03732 [Abditibacteriota bacterium]|nr:hypothetical protein IAD21_03732 [Abditibacteriota bacterium]